MHKHCKKVSAIGLKNILLRKTCTHNCDIILIVCRIELYLLFFIINTSVDSYGYTLFIIKIKFVRVLRLRIGAIYE